jgi:TetR/AcrR family transcriptional repressor of nem operon
MTSDAQTKLISAAMQLMLRQGYSATGIDGICTEAGLSKGAFYHSFRGKEEVALAALDAFHRRGLEELRSVDVSDVPPAERLPVFVERLAERAEAIWEEGCLIGGLATEMARTSDALQERVARSFDELAALVAELAAPYVSALPVRGLEPVAVAEDLLAFIEGTIILARGHRDPKLLRQSLRRYALQLRAVAGTPQKPSPQD